MKNLKGEVRHLHVEVDHTLALAHSIQHFTWESKATGKTNEIFYRQSDVLKKINGRGQIVHQHMSLPIDEKTGQAVRNFE